MLTKLTKSQAMAIEYISDYARSRKYEANKDINEILAMSNIERSTFDEAISKLKTHARVALHFHPDRPTSNMRTIAEALLEQGVYKSQFETLLSNGGVSAYPGGERDLWEKNLFGGAYHIEGATDNQRPKYGALDVMLHPDGPSPRFGSCYFLLSPEVSKRCTYTHLSSHLDPKEKGTYEELDDIIAALMRESFTRDFAIGEKDLTPRRLVDQMLYDLEKKLIDPSLKKPNRNLNHFIEAQIHGDISLCDDADILVADPSFKGNDIGYTLEKICYKYNIKLFWHMGFVLPLANVPSDFRGAKMPSLAKRIGNNHCVNANTIGLAAMNLKEHPEVWADRGTYEEVLQELKLIWHMLVRFGLPLEDYKRTYCNQNDI